MTQFDENGLAKLFHLCRIEYSGEEKKQFLKNFNKILSYIELLQEVQTDHVSPTNHLFETVSNQLRDDEVSDLLSRDDFLSNAPSHVGGMVRVPPVIKF